MLIAIHHVKAKGIFVAHPIVLPIIIRTELSVPYVTKACIYKTNSVPFFTGYGIQYSRIRFDSGVLGFNEETTCVISGKHMLGCC